MSLFSSGNKQKGLNGSICCTANLYVPLSVNGAVTDVHVTHDTGANRPPCHHRHLRYTRDENKLILFLLCLEGSGVPRARQSLNLHLQMLRKKLLLAVVHRIFLVFYYAAPPRGSKVASIRFQFAVFALYMREFLTAL